MLTKEKAADLIIINKSGGDASQTSKYDKRVIYYWLDIARATMIAEEYKKSWNIADVFLKSYVTEVLEDSSRGQKYFTFPVNIISITHRHGGELGIYRVSATKSNQDAFSIMRTGMNDVMKVLDGEDPNKTSVSLEGNKGYFDKISADVESVRVTLIPSLEGIESNEPIPIPGDREADLINLASQMMDEEKSTVQDKTNDTNSQQI